MYLLFSDISSEQEYQTAEKVLGDIHGVKTTKSDKDSKFRSKCSSVREQEQTTQHTTSANETDDGINDYDNSVIQEIKTEIGAVGSESKTASPLFFNKLVVEDNAEEEDIPTDETELQLDFKSTGSGINNISLGGWDMETLVYTCTAPHVVLTPLEKGYKTLDFVTVENNQKRKSCKSRNLAVNTCKVVKNNAKVLHTEPEAPQKVHKNKIALENFKTLLKEWPMKTVDEPGFFRNNVSYGAWLKPIETPDDLDSDFFSKSKTGYFCHNCSLLFKGVTTFIKHRVKTDGRCYYECDVCNKKYCVESEMLIHKKYHSAIKPHICEFCDKAFLKKDKMNLHIQQQHKTVSAYVCNICGKAFKIKPCLNSHLKTVHVAEDDKFLCTLCPKKFKCIYSLKMHTYSHSDECHYPCDKCGKAFKTDYLLRRHVKRHSQERRHFCPDCGKGFYKLYYLKNHMIIHSGLKPFSCSFCSYKCNIKWNLDKHMKTHSK